MHEIDPLISQYQHHEHRPQQAEALLMLRKVASIVKPIMRRRCWRVGTLSEFYPGNQRLLGLNVNHGEKVCLRLRQSRDQNRFLPFEEVVDTMLHELCHIEHGPHNQQFNALWNQLRDEHEELIMKGYTGEGFLSVGKRLGGRRMPIDEARRQARAAAERRRVLSSGSGQRLGGAPVLRGADMRKAIADAAQRRIDITQGCASGAENCSELAEEAARNGFPTKAEEDDANEQAIMQVYIDLIEEEEREKYGSSYIPPSQANPAGPRSILSPPPIPQATTNDSIPSQSRAPVDLTTDDTLYEQPWTCTMCTLENPPNFLCCDACASERPRPTSSRTASESITSKVGETETSRNNKKRPLSQSPAHNTFRNRTNAVKSLTELEKNASKRPLGWLCNSCGAFMETEWWTCSSCGRMKQTS